jgi:hypothetical protein
MATTVYYVRHPYLTDDFFGQSCRRSTYLAEIRRSHLCQGALHRTRVQSTCRPNWRSCQPVAAGHTVQQLRQRFEVVRLPFPCCAHTHSVVILSQQARLIPEPAHNVHHRLPEQALLDALAAVVLDIEQELQTCEPLLMLFNIRLLYSLNSVSTQWAACT